MINKQLKIFNDQLDLELKQNQEWLFCGGTAGHMAHPYDLGSVDAFVKFWDEFLAGNLTTTEKVDGYNLFIGLNDKKEIVSVRTKKEDPFTSPGDKFRKQHGGRGAFVGGFKAIKSKLEQLTDKELYHYRLIDEKGKPLNFINTEIIYGEQPNLIPYSKTNNYIVFHTHSGTRDNEYSMSDDLDSGESKKLLIQLANKLNDTATTQSKAVYSGDDEISREYKSENTYWQFKGPITFSKNQLEKQIPQNVISLWERKKLELLQFQSNDDSKKEMMKNISAELGGLILKGMSSKLADSDTKVKTGFPGIEGLAINYKNDLVKITGDFAALNQETVRPTNFLASLQELVANDILKLKLKKIDKRNVEKYGNISNLLATRNKKMDYDVEIERKNEVLGEAVKAVRALKEFKAANSSISFVEASVNSSIVDLQNFIKDVERASTLKQLARAFFENLFWQKSRRLSEKNIFNKMRNELL